MKNSKNQMVTFPHKVLILILLFTAIVVQAMFLINTAQGGEKQEGKLELVEGLTISEYANRVVRICAQESSQVQERLACYDRTIPRLMDFLSMEEAFEVTRIVTSEDPNYLHCHVLAHNLASRETAKDPSNWWEVVGRCPSLECNNGCPHGAMLASFQNESEVLTEEQIERMKPDLRKVCAKRSGWNPSIIEESMCNHALGHLSLYATNADVDKSIELCRDVAKGYNGKDFVEPCIQGVFMQIFQPLDPEDEALVGDIRPENKREVLELCGEYEGESFLACHQESWPVFFPAILKSQGAKEFCAYTSDKIRCIANLVNKVANQFLIEREQLYKFEEYCSGFGEDLKPVCVAYGSRWLIQVDERLIDKALETCRAAEKAGVGKDCNTLLAFFGTLNFNKGSEKRLRYCKALPESWREQCISGFEPSFSWGKKL